MGLLRAPDGSIVSVPDEEAGQAISGGYAAVTPSEAGAPVEREATGGVLGAINAGASSTLSGLTLGASDYALKGLLNRGQFARYAADREDHPIVSGVGQVAGSILPSLVAPESLLARSPAGIVSRAAAGVAEGGGAARALAAAGLEGAAQNAGAYLADSALGDRDLSAEGLAGALGTGLAFGAGGGAAALGIERGTIAARRMFSRLVDGTSKATEAAEQAWKTSYQTAIEANDAAADIARAKLAAAQQARMQAGLARDQAAAGLADARVGAPVADAAHAGATRLDDAIGKIEGQMSPPAAVQAAQAPAGTGGLDALGAALAGGAPREQILSEAAEREIAEAVAGHDAARADLEDVLRRISAPDVGEIGGTIGQHAVPIGEFGAPGVGGVATPGDLASAAVAAGEPGTLGASRRAEPTRVLGRAAESDAGSRAGRSLADGTPVGAAPGPQRVEVVRVGRPSAGTFEARAADGTVTPLAKGQASGWADAAMPPGFTAGPSLEPHRPFSIETDLPASHADVVDNGVYVVRPSQIAERGAMGNELHAEHVASLDSLEAGKRIPPLEARMTPDGRLWIEDGNHRLQRAVPDDAPVALRIKAVGDEWKPQAGARDITDRLQRTSSPGPEASSAAVADRPPATVISDDDFKAMQAEYASKLTPKEDRNLATYVQSTHKDLNRALRHGEIRNGREKILAELDSALEKASLPQRTTLYRGLSGKDAEQFGKLEAGDRFTELAYSSTSSNPNVFKREVNLHIDVPEGYQAAPIPSNIDEKEFLLRRNTRYEVTSVVEDGKAKTINVRVVDSDPPPRIADMVSDKVGRQTDAPPIRIEKAAGPASTTAKLPGPGKPVALQEVERQLADAGVRDADTIGVLRDGGAPGIYEIPKHGALDLELAKSGEDFADGFLHARDLAKHGYYETPGGHGDAALTAKARTAIAEGQREPIQLGIAPSGEVVVIGGRKRLAAAIEADAPVHVQWTTSREPTGDLVHHGGRPSAAPPASTDTLTGLLRGTQDKLAAGGELSAIGAPARAEYAAAKATRTAEAADHFRGAARAENYAGSQMAAHEIAAQQEAIARRATADHPLDARRLEMAHDSAVERALTATEPAELAAATAEADAIQAQLTKIGRRPGAVEDVAAVAEKVTGYERASARLADAIGDEAPPAAREAATAFRAAEDAADRKMIARTTRAVDDHVELAQVGPDRRPSAYPSGAERVAAAKSQKLTADAALARTRALETEAKIGARQASETAAWTRATAKAARPAPVAVAQESSRLGSFVTALGVAGELGIPGVPHPHDIPIIGPLLSMYVKYRAIKAAAGRFAGRIPATGEARAAALVARTKDKVVSAVDRTLGLAAEVAPKARGAIVATTVALGGRLIDDGHPDAPAGSSQQQLAATRIREISFAASRPDLVTEKVRVQLRGINDPDLIAAAERHMIARFQHFADVMPKGPPPNPYTKTTWVPSAAEAHELSQRLAVADDPTHAFTSPNPATISTTQALYPQLLALAKQRLLERVSDIEHPVPPTKLMRASLLFDLPLLPSMEPASIAVLQSAHASTKEPAAPQPGSPPVPSVANPTDLSSLYQPAGERRAARK